ncbi:MAG TPA: hypothetical protein VIX82_17705 [Solirubrobacteraceae bacterium]
MAAGGDVAYAHDAVDALADDQPLAAGEGVAAELDTLADGIAVPA